MLDAGAHGGNVITVLVSGAQGDSSSFYLQVNCPTVAYTGLFVKKGMRAKIGTLTGSDNRVLFDALSS